MNTDEQSALCERPSVIVPPQRSSCIITPSTSAQDGCTLNSIDVPTAENAHQVKNTISNSNGCFVRVPEEDQQQLSRCHYERNGEKSRKQRKKRSYKTNASKVCLVCGDESKSLHFGAMCCDSCKAFFRRSVQSSSYSSFTCNFQTNCEITKEARKSCQFCRFQKCLNVGMKTTLVMPASERITLWKSRLQKYKKPQRPPLLQKKNTVNNISTHRLPFTNALSATEMNGMSFNNPSIGNLAPLIHSQGTSRQESFNDIPSKPFRDDYPHHSCITYSQNLASSNTINHGASCSILLEPTHQTCVLSKEDQKLILHLVELQKIAFLSTPYSDDCFGDTIASMGNIFFCTCAKVYALLSRIEDLYILCKEDRKILLKNGVAMALYVYGAYMYDTDLKQFPDANCISYLRIPNVITLPTLRSFAIFPEVFHLIMTFYNNYANNIKDEVTVVLLCIIALFSENSGLVDLKTCAELRNRYVALLRNYLVDKVGEERCMDLLPKFLQGFSMLKGIALNHDKVNIQIMPTSSNPLMCQPFLKTQMVALTALLERALTTSLPKYASVLKSNHSIETILYKNSKSVIRKSSNANGSGPYSPLTCAIFGQENKTDDLAAILWQEILSGDHPNLLLQINSMIK